MAEHKDLYNPYRQDLGAVVPLATPYKLNIEPTNLCNIGCTFCPTADHALVKSVRPQGIMTFELFKKLVEDIKEFPDKVKLMELYQDGEPLINKNFPEMARYLYDAGVAEKTKTKTNGVLLTPSMVERLAESRLTYIGISVLASNERDYQTIAQRKIHYADIVENVRRLHKATRGTETKLYIKMAQMPHFTQADIDQFYRDFESSADHIVIEQLHGWSRTEVQDFSEGMFQARGEPVACPYPLYQLTINWNGAVRTCCVDWSWKTTIGDAATNSVKQVWEGLQLYEFQRMHLEGRRHENIACKNCTLIHIRLDDIDNQRLEILERIHEGRHKLEQKVLP